MRFCTGVRGVVFGRNAYERLSLSVCAAQKSDSEMAGPRRGWAQRWEFPQPSLGGFSYWQLGLVSPPRLVSGAV